MTISELKEHNIAELSKLARGLDIAGTSGLRKQDLIFKIHPRLAIATPEDRYFAWGHGQFS